MTSKLEKLAKKFESIQPRAAENRPAINAKSQTGPGTFLDKTLGRAAAEERVEELTKELEVAKASGRQIVKIRDLVLVPGRKRHLNEQDRANLKANLTHNELIYPVNVFRHKDGSLELVAGYNRVEIYLELGRDEIQADIKEYGEDQALSVAFYSNLFNVPLTDFEKYHGFAQIKDATKKDQSTMARESGMSESLLSNIFAFERLPSQVKDLLHQNPHLIGAKTASKLAQITPILGDAHVGDFVEKFFRGDISSEKMLLDLVAAKPKAKAPQSVDIAKGKQKKFISVTQRNGIIAIRCKDDEIANQYRDQLTEFLRKLIENDSNLAP